MLGGDIPSNHNNDKDTNKDREYKIKLMTQTKQKVSSMLSLATTPPRIPIHCGMAMTHPRNVDLGVDDVGEGTTTTTMEQWVDAALYLRVCGRYELACGNPLDLPLWGSSSAGGEGTTATPTHAPPNDTDRRDERTPSPKETGKGRETDGVDNANANNDDGEGEGDDPVPPHDGIPNEESNSILWEYNGRPSGSGLEDLTTPVDRSLTMQGEDHSPTSMPTPTKQNSHHHNNSNTNHNNNSNTNQEDKETSDDPTRFVVDHPATQLGVPMFPDALLETNTVTRCAPVSLGFGPSQRPLPPFRTRRSTRMRRLNGAVGM